VIGGGDLYLLYNGEVLERSWFQASQAEDYVFTDEEGDVVLIPSGPSSGGSCPTASPSTFAGDHEASSTVPTGLRNRQPLPCPY
jgi:hypothetical protein